MSSKANKNSDNNTNFLNSAGELFIVATPIGNLKDITFRAVEVLKEVDFIICEDTRNTRVLLDSYGIQSKLYQFDDHASDDKLNKIISEISFGKKVALVSDAGTPLISDPGFKLIKEAKNHNLKVTPIPGACALITALCASGLTSESFIFLGFVPKRNSELEDLLKNRQSETSTIIFYESPKRLLETLSIISDVLGQRNIVIARELTKLFEEIFKGSANECIDYFSKKEIKGEIVLLIQGQSESKFESSDAKLLLSEHLKTMSLKDAVSEVSEATKLSKKIVYKLALEITK